MSGNSSELHSRFAAIYQSYSKEIALFLTHYLQNRDDGLDLLQEVFISFINYFKSRELPSDEIHLRRLLFRIARNLAINHTKSFHKRKINYTDNIENEKQRESSAVSVTEEAVMKNFAEQSRNSSLYKVLARLEPEHRTLLLLRYINEMSLEEIGEVVDRSVSAVSRGIERSRRAFLSVSRSIGISIEELLDEQ